MKVLELIEKLNAIEQTIPNCGVCITVLGTIQCPIDSISVIPRKDMKGGMAVLSYDNRSNRRT